MQTPDERTPAELALRRSLMALRLEVPREIVDDVEAKVNDALQARAQQAERAEQRIRELAVLFGVPDGGRYLNDWKTRAEQKQQTVEEALREFHSTYGLVINDSPIDIHPETCSPNVSELWELRDAL